MGDTGSDHLREGPWPDPYEPPTLEPLGSVWDRTGALGGGIPDAGGQLLTIP
jgi:hypothetical protein